MNDNEITDEMIQSYCDDHLHEPGLSALKEAKREWDELVPQLKLLLAFLIYYVTLNQL